MRLNSSFQWRRKKHVKYFIIYSLSYFCYSKLVFNFWFQSLCKLLRNVINIRDSNKAFPVTCKCKNLLFTFMAFDFNGQIWFSQCCLIENHTGLTLQKRSHSNTRSTQTDPEAIWYVPCHFKNVSVLNTHFFYKHLHFGG